MGCLGSKLFSNLSQQHPKFRTTSQHGGQTYATCCAQQCCNMLRWHIAIVWPGLKEQRKTTLSPGQTIATYQHKISQHCWPSICKLRPNDHNISAQHIATLLGATCCARLTTLLRRVTTCCDMLGVWKWSYLSQQHPKSRNTSQQGGQTWATCCAQQCYVEMLWSFGQG